MAKLALLRFPERAVPGDLHRTILEMGQLAQRLMTQAAEVLITNDVDAALQLEQDDDRMDELHRTLFQHLLDDRWKHGVETAVDVTLVGRYYERFADHAVSVAKRVVYLATGEYADELDPGSWPAPATAAARPATSSRRCVVHSGAPVSPSSSPGQHDPTPPPPPSGPGVAVGASEPRVQRWL